MAYEKPAGRAFLLAARGFHDKQAREEVIVTEAIDSRLRELQLFPQAGLPLIALRDQRHFHLLHGQIQSGIFR